MLHLIIALTVNTALGTGAYLTKSLSKSGFAAGVIAGTLIFYLGGLEYWTVMGAFFISSSLVSKYKKSVKAAMADKLEKGDRRDYLQVLANGGIGCAMIVAYHFSRDPVCLLLAVTSFASSNADTWASELGPLARREPVSIVTFRRVPRGTSGGVSIPGTLTSLAGSSFIALAFLGAVSLIHGISADLWRWMPLIIGGGFSGSLFDSLLGATAQGQYYCVGTGSITEKPVTGGEPNRLVRGIRIINNDMVNFLSTLCAVLLTMVIARTACSF